MPRGGKNRKKPAGDGEDADTAAGKAKAEAASPMSTEAHKPSEPSQLPAGAVWGAAAAVAKRASAAASDAPSPPGDSGERFACHICGAIAISGAGADALAAMRVRCRADHEFTVHVKCWDEHKAKYIKGLGKKAFAGKNHHKNSKKYLNEH